MQRRTMLALGLALIAAAIPGAGRAANVYAGDDVIVAVLDTGIRPSHDEFDFRGPDATDDQIVGWWDFTNTLVQPTLPAPGEAWDPRNPLPYDDNGHGTATASLAVGRNRVPANQKAPSFAPGFKLASGKVCDSTGTCGGDIAAAIRWATDTIGADVISISIGAQVPIGDFLSKVHEAARRAREAGVLVVVSNGNGLGNAGLAPGPGWFTSNGDSTEVLSVGASDEAFQLLPTTDPEVTARYWDVPVASNKCDACYTSNTGTSFSAPLVAGMAARAMAEAVANGADASPAHIEQLLKYSARDTLVPPSVEGYGVLDELQLPTVLTHAADGTLPARPEPDLNALYVESGSGTLRNLSSNVLDDGTRGFVPLGVHDMGGPGLMTTGMVGGASEAETYTLDVEAGDLIHVSVRDIDPYYPGFFSLYVFDSTGPIFDWTQLIASSGYVSEEDPSVQFRSPVDRTVTVMVAGRFQFPFNQMAFRPAVTGTSAVPAFAGEDLYATSTTYLD